MKTITLALVLFSGRAFSAECLSYGSEISVTGTLLRKTFLEQQNDEGRAQGDAPATYFFVKPDKPVCVAASRIENNESAEAGVKVMQLLFESSKESYSSLRPHLGRTLQCKGSLLHGISGHHHSRIMILGARCKPLG